MSLLYNRKQDAVFASCSWRHACAGVLLCLLLGTQPGWAATGCNLPPGVEDTTVQVSQASGRALIDVERPTAARQTVEISYNGETYFQTSDAEGRARITLALTAPQNKVSIHQRRFSVIHCEIDAPDFAQIYRVILRWRDPVLLALHVVEPGRKLATFGHVSPARPNTDLTQGLGQIDVATGVPPDGSTGEVSYVVDNVRTLPTGRFFNFRLEYVTRGETAKPPHCDEHPLANIQAQLIIIDAGQVTERSFGTGRAACGQTLSPAARLLPLRP